MKIIFAKNIGFCTGVKRALDISRDSLLKDRKPIRFLGEIIHNERVINEIKKQRGEIIKNPIDAKNGTLVIRAHGTPPLPKLKGVVVRDATCPLVKRAQDAAKSLLRQGFEVIIIGEKKHPEVEGIQGNIRKKGIVIENESVAKKMKKLGKIGVMAQTTQSLEKAEKIIRILEKKSKSLKWVNTLCPQVIFRQKELSKILKKTDGIMVIGSLTSANTARLAEIARAKTKAVWRINSASKLRKTEFKKISALGVVSGTSAPDWEVEEIKIWLNKNFIKKSDDKKKKN
jgi:(E)-4-hydroxy-3-methyl-but-2-enyl pyrophosphate reductase